MSKIVVPVKDKVYSGFSPLTIPGCGIWLDGADNNTITGSSSISGWSNKGLNTDNAFVRTGTASTGFSASLSVNGLNFIRVPSGGNTLGLTTTLNTQPRSWFFVCRGTGASTYTYMIQATVTYSDSIYYENLSGGPAILEGVNGYTFNVGGYVSAAEQSVPSVFSFVNAVNSSCNAFSYNGTPRATPSGFAAGAAGYNTGNITYSFGNGGFDFMEIIFYSNDLLPRHREQVEGYLGWKWGIRTSFPTTHPYYSYPPAIRLFKPSDLAGNVLWVDPSDVSTLTFASGTSNVTSMSDKGSNGPLFATSGTVPLCNSVIGGLSALYFASVYTNYMGATVNPITSSNLSIFAVSVQSNGGSQSAAGRLLSFGSNGQYDFNNNLYGFVGNNSSNNLSPYRNGWKSGVTLTGGQPYVSSTIYDGTNATITAYGVSYAGSTATSSAGGGSFYINTFIIGAEPAPDGNAAWYGYIGEIIVYDRTLLTGERQLVEGYLAWKWGVKTYLTSNHVSVKFRPYIVPPIYSTSGVTNRLYMYFPFNGSATDMCGTLTTIPNITFTGAGPSYVSGLYSRQAVYLPNESQSARHLVANTYFTTATMPTSNFTVCMWYNPTNVQYGSLFHSVGNGSYVASSVVLVIIGGVTYAAYMAQRGMSGASVSTGTWYHATITYDGYNLAFYHNAIFYNSINASGIATPYVSGFEIGNAQDSSSTYYPFSGYIQDYRIYNRIIAPAEISNIYSNS